MDPAEPFQQVLGKVGFAMLQIFDDASMTKPLGFVNCGKNVFG